ncbi:hypothetical protein GCM10009413_32540 [Tatumella punctata]
MRIKPEKRLKRDKPEPLAVSESRNISGFMDLLSEWRSVRLLNMTDDFNREALAIEVNFSLPAIRVIKTLESIIEWKGKPSSIRRDNGPEYTGNILMQYIYRIN